ncbi:regenerating islet-derived protein 4-like isoform X2 [Denticeps clupeoides]|uniref:regenerating islet-derived protein 4-like isoform X2 n=1 Tax=Denticeps clupeoides TaxID=299321 RepID=UPI0010A48A14|nr:regenerating islet-derived protein 4-like isoform X2 [Denticeps clupeoides]
MCHYVYQGSNATLKTYEYVKDMKNWSDAQTACRSNGGELASIMNDKEQQAFVVMAPAGYSIWIGLSRNPVTQLWEWSSNNSFTTLFPPVNPGQNCTKLVNANQGKTDSCSVNKQVLCIRGTALPVTEVVSRNVVRVSMQLVGQVDPNDPVFAKQVLDTLQVQLAIRGTFNGNLNWTYQEDDKVFREKESSMTQP